MNLFQLTLSALLLSASFASVAADKKADHAPDRAALNDVRNASDAKESWERTHRASKIIGTDVRNKQGEALGEIRELVLNPVNGDLSYAVISFGGVMGLGDKLFAVPWKALKLDGARNEFILDVDKERLKTAPGFDANRWPDMANTQWNNDVHRYYGQRFESNSGRTGSTPR